MKKDWIGNYTSVFSTLGASSHSNKEREQNDYYATDPIAIDPLMSVIDMPQKVWECACGEGHLSRRMIELGYEVYSSDIKDRGYGKILDFLAQDSMPEGCNCIVTNPPYKFALEFVLHSLELLHEEGICAMFLKTTFLEGQKRYDKLFRNAPPQYMLQFSKRVYCAKNGNFQHKHEGSAVAYAWFVWRKGYKGLTTIKWI